MTVMVFVFSVALALFFLIFAIGFVRRSRRVGGASTGWYSDGGASHSDSGSAVDCSSSDGGGGCDGGGGGD